MSDTQLKRKRELTRLRSKRYRKRRREDNDELEKEDVRPSTSSTSLSTPSDMNNKDNNFPVINMLDGVDDLSKLPTTSDMNISPELLQLQDDLRLSMLNRYQTNDAVTSIAEDFSGLINESESIIRDEEEIIGDPLSVDNNSGQSSIDALDNGNEDLFEKIHQWSLSAKLPTKHLDSLFELLRKNVLPDLPVSSKIIGRYQNGKIGAKGIFDGSGTPNKNKIPNTSDLMGKMTEIQRSISELQSRMTTMHGDCTEIKDSLETFMKSSARTGRNSHIKAVLLKNHFCDSMDKLEDFDFRLKTDPEFRRLICQGIWACIDVELPVQRSIGEILKELMSKDVLNNFTAQRATKNKKVLIELELWNCIQETVIEEWQEAQLPPMKKKTLEGALGKVINSSKDWGEKNRSTNDKVEMIFLKEEKSKDF